MVKIMATNLCIRDNNQPASNQAPMQQPRINFGMILHMKFGLETVPGDDKSAEMYRGQVFEASVPQT